MEKRKPGRPKKVDPTAIAKKRLLEWSPGTVPPPARFTNKVEDPLGVAYVCGVFARKEAEAEGKSLPEAKKIQSEVFYRTARSLGAPASKPRTREHRDEIYQQRKRLAHIEENILIASIDPAEVFRDTIKDWARNWARMDYAECVEAITDDLRYAVKRCAGLISYTGPMMHHRQATPFPPTWDSALESLRSAVGYYRHHIDEIGPDPVPAAFCRATSNFDRLVKDCLKTNP